MSDEGLVKSALATPVSDDEKAERGVISGGVLQSLKLDDGSGGDDR